MRKKSLIEENAQNGVLGAIHTQKNFVKFYPAYQIDKVKLSFVKTGTKGEGFDIYLDILTFDNLADEILSGKLYKKLLSEQVTESNRYPFSFRFVTGENAEKEVKLMKAQKADVNIYGKSGKDYMNIPCSYDELRNISKLFKLTVKKRMEYLTSLYADYETKQSEYRNVEDDKPVIHEEEEHGETESCTEKPEPSKPVAKQDNPVVIYKLATIGEMKKKKNLYVVEVQDEEDPEPKKLFFNEQSIQTISTEMFEKLCSKIKKGSVSMNAKVEENGNNLLFINFAV